MMVKPPVHGAAEGVFNGEVGAAGASACHADGKVSSYSVGRVRHGVHPCGVQSHGC